MVQARICSYYKSSCLHSNTRVTTFLSLSEDLRDRIYEHVGLPSGSAIRILGKDIPVRTQGGPYYISELFCNRGTHGPMYYRWDDYDDEEVSETYLGLSLSNSLVGADVARFLSQHNELVLCCENYTDLDMLLRSPLSWMRLLKRLTIHLNLAFPYTWAAYWRDVCHHRSSGTNPDRLLVSTSKQYSALMGLWRQAVSRLASVVVHNSEFNLKVLCDVQDTEAAQGMIDVLEDHGLASTALRLAGTRDARLQEMARQAVLRSHPAKDQSFPFTALPLELQQHVLSFTDLVTPAGQVTCAEGRYCCVAYNATGVPMRARAWPCKSREFCALEAAVYPHCSCWVPPTPLFLVCKDMLDLARTVFFTSNRFVLAMEYRRAARTYPETHGACISFLRRCEALPHLRSLEIVFSPVWYDFSGIDADAYKMWTETVHYLAAHVKRLSLRLNLMHGVSEPPREISPRTCTLVELENLFRVHEQIVRPLREIDAIDDCFVRAIPHYRSGEAQFEERLRDHEKRLEMLVMGSGYDSTARGKSTPHNEEWIKSYDGFEVAWCELCDEQY